jgi:hypothetical protein
MPGAMTVREILDALEAGADIIKLFPGEAFGPGIVKALRAPLPQAPLMPTGGVSLDNVAEWSAPVRPRWAWAAASPPAPGPAMAGHHAHCTPVRRADRRGPPPGLNEQGGPGAMGEPRRTGTGDVPA